MSEQKPDRPDRSMGRPGRSASDFEAFFREHYAFVRRAVARSTGPHCSDVEDLAQEVFLVAMDKLHTFDGRSKPTTWLYGITWRVVSQYRRRQMIRRWVTFGFEEDVMAERGQEPERQMVGLEECREVYAVLNKMADKKRQTLILYELEGFSGEEIAQIMGCKEATVWTRLHYAREEFRDKAARRASIQGSGNASCPGTKGARE